VTNCATLVVLTNTAATALTPLSLCPGTMANFATVASGTGPFTYLWRKGGAAISGATNSSYTIPAVVAADAGLYAVEVTGFCSSVTNSATLTVLTNLTATTPMALTLCPGNTASFQTVASGTGPFLYQWRKNGSTISGATNAS